MSAEQYEVPQAHIPVMERNTYVPAWTPRFADLSRHVVDKNGGDLGFTIGQVLPERRWAIQPGGQLLAQVDFEQRYKQWVSNVVTGNGTIIRLSNVNKYFDANLETVPLVDDFVDAKPDPNMPDDPTRFVPIAYDPIPDSRHRSKIRPVYTHTGEKIEDAKEEPAAPPPGFDAVLPQKPAPKDAKVHPVEVMACGKEIRTSYKKQHIRFCKKGCKPSEASAE